MSDRKNRDIGNKRANKREPWACSCWLCWPAKLKRIEMNHKEQRKDKLSKFAKEFD